MPAGHEQNEPGRAEHVARLFDVPVEAHELYGQGRPGWLLPDETTEATAMGPGRIAEFAAGRACARRGIGALGEPEAPLLSGDDRPPIWPAHVHGSISHTRGYCAAAVARLDDLGSSRIGLDAERVGRVHEKLWRRLFTAPEIEHLHKLTDPSLSATVMFSVKEAYYKAQYPTTTAWVGFDDVRVEWTDTGVRLFPVTDLAALTAIMWPIDARWYSQPDDAGEDTLVLTGVQAHPASSLAAAVGAASDSLGITR